MKTPVTFPTHFEAFLDFAEKQPFDRIIDHSAGNWCGCAVGDYHREATSIPPVGGGVDADDNDQLTDSPLLGELQKHHMYIFESLNQGSVPCNIDEDEGVEDGYEINTYQGLARFMRAAEGRDIDDFFADSE